MSEVTSVSFSSIGILTEDFPPVIGKASRVFSFPCAKSRATTPEKYDGARQTAIRHGGGSSQNIKWATTTVDGRGGTKETASNVFGCQK